MNGRPAGAKSVVLRRLVLGGALALLAGCGTARVPAAVETAAPVAAPVERRAAAATTTEPDPLEAFYARVEGELTASGRMRADTAPADAPFTEADLVRNFERIALYDEYVSIGGRFMRSETPALLRRWVRPVRVGVVTGPSVPPGMAAQDRANVAVFTRQLARLTGHDIALGNGDDANFLVMVLDSAEQAEAASLTRAAYPDFEPAVIAALGATPIDTFCTAYAFSERDRPSEYAAVMVLIRAEHPPLTRMSCVQEEMAQAMGLPNDSPDARPSLFNDSLEFAHLTEHDAILLRMLYDPRLRPGMSAMEVRPLLPAIARDAMAAHYGGARLAGLGAG